MTTIRVLRIKMGEQVADFEIDSRGTLVIKFADQHVQVESRLIIPRRDSIALAEFITQAQGARIGPVSRAPKAKPVYKDEREEVEAKERPGSDKENIERHADGIEGGMV